MTFIVSGFCVSQKEIKDTAPRKSSVHIRFPAKGMALSYYNNPFDLKLGDLVYMDGKWEGLSFLFTKFIYYGILLYKWFLS